MTRYIFIMLLSIGLVVPSFAKQADFISTVEFVEVLNQHHEEARFYYQNNWKVFREKAQAKGVIADFQLLETKATKEARFAFILITTYADTKSYVQREANFQAIIAESDGIKLLNKIEPKDFRRSFAVKENVKHL